MPKSCCAVGCANHNMMPKKLSFFRIPKNHDRYNQWLSALKRDTPSGKPWQPTHNSRICSDHFITGKPNDDPDHPDYVPSVFSYGGNNQSLQTKKMDRYQSAAKRKMRFETPVRSKQSRLEVTPHQSPEKENIGTCTSPFSDHEDISNLDEAFCSSPVTPLHKTMSSSEREKLYIEIDHLRRERDTLEDKVSGLTDQINQSRFSADLIENNDTKSKFYTGLPWDVFISIFTYLVTFMNRTPLVNKLSFRDQFFVTLCKLRFNMPFEYLSDQCQIPTSTIHDMFWRWVETMSLNLDFLVHWPDRETMRRTLPSVFKNKFPRLTCIIDCFEIFIDRPQRLHARAQCYSNYKKHSTIKVLIGCSSIGSITFLSTAWGGRVSDIEIVRSSGFISPNLHLPGDQILADRGFTLQEEFASVCSAELLIPSFTKGKSQLSAQESETSKKISSVRIHIERVIGLMKNRFRILEGPISLSMIKSVGDEASDNCEPRIDKLLHVCAALTNLGDGIVYKEDSCAENVNVDS